ncbi:MAG: class I SAM-dependent methyltransferase, partial [Chitinophagales bacterium]
MINANKTKSAVKSFIRKSLRIKPDFHLLDTKTSTPQLNSVLNKILSFQPRVTHPAEFITLGTLALTSKFNIIEVGCYLGYSSCVMASAIKEGRKVFAIDIFDREKGWSNGSTDDKIFKNYSQWDWALKVAEEIGVKNKIEFIRSDSIAAIEKINTRIEQVDLIFIDADHSYNSCIADLNAYSKLVEPGGYLVAHDYLNSFHPGVKKAVDEFLNFNKNFSAIYNVQSMII